MNVVGHLNSLDMFNARLRTWIGGPMSDLGYELRTLGGVNGHPLWLICPQNAESSCTKLIAAGFHGNEPCGPWAVLEFLETRLSNYVERGGPAFLPLVNPTGFKCNTRENWLGENPNAGFCEYPSVEGRILLEHVDLLGRVSREGFVSLHEDWEQARAYLYAFEHSSEPTAFSYELVGTLRAHFELVPDGLWEGAWMRDGIAFNLYDGSFENYLFDKGAVYAACVETPGLREPTRRIRAHVGIMETFLRQDG